MSLSDLTRDEMIATVTDGSDGSAMMAFASVLNRSEIEAVVDYVRAAFIAGDEINTLYHIPENGWEDHQQYASAFPFALGEIALDTPWDELTPEQREGRQLFLTSCVTCHDRSKVNDEGELWDPRAVSYPRGGYSHKTADQAQAGGGVESEIDAVSAATPFARHERAPQVDGLTSKQQLGEKIFQANCAFCHGATATGRNWIGSFLQPHPRDLTDRDAMAGMNQQRLTKVITEGLPGTSMSAWGSVLSSDQIDAVADYVMHVFVPTDAAE